MYSSVWVCLLRKVYGHPTLPQFTCLLVILSPIPLLIYFKYGLLAPWLPFPQLNLPNTVISLHSGISSNRLCFTLRIHSLVCLSPPPCWGQLPDRLLKQHCFLKCSSQVLHLFWAASVLQLQQHFSCSVFPHFQAAITSISPQNKQGQWCLTGQPACSVPQRPGLWGPAGSAPVCSIRAGGAQPPGRKTANPCACFWVWAGVHKGYCGFYHID